MITAFHGIGAYRGQRNPIALKRALDIALTGVELCCADRPIGAFGAVLMGDHKATFDCDVWSKVDEDGDRYIEGYDEPVYTGDCQKKYELACREAMNIEYRHKGIKGYCESWIKPAVLRAVWVKDWASDEVKNCAYIISKHRKVPLIFVGGKTRIWQVLDFYKLPLRVAK